MNIAILGLTATSYGSLTYLKNFLPHLAQLDRSNHYELFLPADNARDLDVRQPNFRIHTHRGAPKSGTLRVLWEQLVLPWFLRGQRVGVVYTTHNMAVLLSPTPSIIIIQNVEPFFAGQFPNALHLRARLWLLRIMTRLSLRRSHKIIAISEWEKEFLVERFHLPPDKIIVSYPGVTEGFHPPASGSTTLLRETLGLAPPYILSVTRLAGYGNLLNLAKAYASLVKAGKVTMPLVIAGGVWDSQYIGRVKGLLTAEGCADRVKFLGYVPHQHMPLLFGHAACLVFPSLLEACGTVLIEALACGTPILCCRRRPMTDICGDAAVLFEGEDPNNIANKIFEVLSDPPLREALSRRAVARATQFSWQQGAEKVHRIFEQLTPAPRAASRGAENLPPERRTSPLSYSPGSAHQNPFRLLIYSIRYAPEFTSNAIVITGLAQQLAARGHQVTVLAGTPHYQLPRVPPGYRWRPFRREIREGVKIIRCWAFPKSEGKVAKFLNYTSFTLTSLVAGLFTKRPEAVIIVSPPFWLAFNALLLRAFRRYAIIYNAQDLFPDAYLASKEVRAGWLTRAMSGLMTRIYGASDRITVITGSFAEAIAARGIDRGKVVTIPNFVDTTAVTPLPRANSFRRRHALGDKYIVMYAGNIGYTHGTELLVDAAANLTFIPDLLFLVIGGGSKQADLARLARQRRLPNMQFLPTQPREFLPEMLATADAFVLTSKPGVGKTSFPGRIYNCLLAARPVVASVDENSDLAQFLRSGGAGIVTAPGNVENFCQALTTLYYDAPLRERLGRSGAEFMVRHYSPQAVVEQYETLLKGLTAR